MAKKKDEDKESPLTDLGALVGEMIKDYRNVGLPMEKGKVDCDFIDTGNYALNYIMSGSFDNGLPSGQVTEIHGDPSTGKSLLLYNIIANFLKKYPRGVVVLDDTEQAYVQYLGSKLDIDESRLIKISSATVEDHMNMIFRGGKILNQVNDESKEIDVAEPIISKLLNAGVENIMIAIDSVAVMSTKHEQDVGLDKPDMSKAKVLKALLRVAVPYIKKYKITYIVTNHLIHMIGSMIPNQKTTPGGGGIVYQSSIRLGMSNAGKLKVKDTNLIAGVKSRVTTVKNRFAPPFRQAELEIMFNAGLSRYSGIVSLLMGLGVLKMTSGGWYTVIDTDYKFQQKQLPEKWEEIRKLLNDKQILQREQVIVDDKGSESDQFGYEEDEGGND
jgi:recombination protein RecA